MKTIYKPHATPFSVLGKQKIHKNSSYRLFNYCLLKKIEDDFVLYNNLTKSAVILNDSEIEAIKHLPARINDDLITLAEEWYIVPIEHDDLRLCDQLFDTLELFEDKNKIVNYTILTTTDCNARCFYCFEHSLKRRNMSLQIANDCADYIIKNCKGSPINIKWFGGEPIFNVEAIDIICDKLTENNVQFVSTMISNGYLFDEGMIKRATEKWHLKRVQITLDGTEEIYNRTKAYIYKDIPSPFITVTNNIEKLATSGIHTRVRLNLTKQNSKNLYELVDWMSERYIHKENISMYCAAVWEYDKERSQMNWSGLLDEKVKMNSYIYEKGFKKISLIYNAVERGCKAQRHNSVIVMPNGDLGKCDTLLDDKLFGSIYTNRKDEQAINYWFRRNVIEKCKTCISYPSCAAYNSCPNFIDNCEFVTSKYHEDRVALNMHTIYKEYMKNKGE